MRRARAVIQSVVGQTSHTKNHTIPPHTTHHTTTPHHTTPHSTHRTSPNAVLNRTTPLYLTVTLLPPNLLRVREVKNQQKIMIIMGADVPGFSRQASIWPNRGSENTPLGTLGAGENRQSSTSDGQIFI
ncbi:hypothetical protein BDDG_01099 [Blastomyces dermatitidis ATCC 18188]|uniref:Uncharacterized protein n=1 Tax=Ajellomyces dermatitidis (strain ATCC 18188 / CBS 674.68) TaxID=653446 RepID=F2T4T7_AJEDA|nr:hypothetical protein BDDG_01099 [Blastomyces dermatitidis ATCC 18188]